jgi:hypothetical protein
MKTEFELTVNRSVLDVSQNATKPWNGYVDWRKQHKIIGHEFIGRSQMVSSLQFEDELSRTNFILSFC